MNFSKSHLLAEHTTNVDFDDLKGSTVLVAMPGAYAAMDLCALIEAHNGRAVGPIATVAEALGILRNVAIDMAVVDADINDCVSLTDHLAIQQIPSLLLAGAASDAEPEIICRQIVLVVKPANPTNMISALATFSATLQLRAERNQRCSDE